MGKNIYSSETKWAVVKDKMSGQLTTKEIMAKHGIKNKSQVETWMRWYRANEIHRFDQPIGKQYSFGHGPEFASVLTEVEEAIIALCKKTKYRFGYRKIKKLLKSAYNLDRHRNTVQTIMQKHHLQCRVKPKRKWQSQGESVIIAPNLLQRDFTATAPNQKWVTDITYIQYGSSTMYLSTIIDLFNNEIVAYNLYNHQQTPLVSDTLKAALEKRSLDHPFRSRERVYIICLSGIG